MFYRIPIAVKVKANILMQQTPTEQINALNYRLHANLVLEITIHV